MRLTILLNFLFIASISYGQNEFGVGTAFCRVLGEVEDLGISMNMLKSAYKHKVHDNAWLQIELAVARTEGLDMTRSFHPTVSRVGNLREIDYQAYTNSLGNHVHFRTDFVFLNLGSTIRPLSYVKKFDKSILSSILSLEYNVGVFYHKTKIDILDHNNTIYSLANPWGMGSINREAIIRNREKVYENVYDQDFETVFNVDNENIKMFISAGLGLNFPLAKKINLVISSLYYFQQSDYLDALRYARPENVNRKSNEDGIQSFNITAYYKI